MTLLNVLPDYLIWEVFSFYVAKGSDLMTLSLLSESERNLVVDMASDENSVVWELLFKARNHWLHQAMVQAKDSRSSWQVRLLAHMSAQSQAKSDGVLLRPKKMKNPLGWLISKIFRKLPSKELTTSSFDLYFYNHPKHGLQVNIGKLNRSVFVYAVRRHLHQSQKSVAEVALEPFDLPVRDEQTQSFGIQTGPPLVLMSVDGREISSFESYFHLLKFVGEKKKEVDFSCWRFLSPDQCRWEVQNGAFLFPSACLLPKQEEV